MSHPTIGTIDVGALRAPYAARPVVPSRAERGPAVRVLVLMGPSGQEVEVLLASWHGMDDQILARLEDQDHSLDWAARRVPPSSI